MKTERILYINTSQIKGPRKIFYVVICMIIPWAKMRRRLKDNKADPKTLISIAMHEILI